ncbi:hypothetical protein EXN66_Car013627 [Channa argus]|uniref:Uncharacterized protein n=1 Tax=Channa argus TaxID=215402 RepID=A0A6G1Q700_CHAAH|nr:hypothetical protein EXN66_Car013627 [Channa argus]
MSEPDFFTDFYETFTIHVEDLNLSKEHIKFKSCTYLSSLKQMCHILFLLQWPDSHSRYSHLNLYS